MLHTCDLANRSLVMDILGGVDFMGVGSKPLLLGLGL